MNQGNDISEFFGVYRGFIGVSGAPPIFSELELRITENEILSKHKNQRQEIEETRVPTQSLRPLLPDDVKRYFGENFGGQGDDLIVGYVTEDGGTNYLFSRRKEITGFSVTVSKTEDFSIPSVLFDTQGETGDFKKYLDDMLKGEIGEGSYYRLDD